jgi:hypothetical protein
VYTLIRVKEREELKMEEYRFGMFDEVEFEGMTHDEVVTLLEEAQVVFEDMGYEIVVGDYSEAHLVLWFEDGVYEDGYESEFGED